MFVVKIIQLTNKKHYVQSTTDIIFSIYNDWNNHKNCQEYNIQSTMIKAELLLWQEDHHIVRLSTKKIKQQ